MGLNDNLIKARRAKNDEFYTQLSDIEKELKHYKEHFKDKIVYCNCDTEESNFVKYFRDNFKELELKELLYTGLPVDFRSEESIELLKEADIIVTNPPFSLFGEYITQLIEHKKKFLIIGNMNAVAHKNIFKYIVDKELWLGVNRVYEFLTPEKGVSRVNATWFTNLKRSKQNEELVLTKTYNEKDYPKYDNYNAIEVSKVANIPADYEGVMGVPITFLSKYNSEQFEILGCVVPAINIKTFIEKKEFKEFKSRQRVINGEICQKTYHRIIIRKKK